MIYLCGLWFQGHFNVPGACSKLYLGFPVVTAGTVREGTKVLPGWPPGVSCTWGRLPSPGQVPKACVLRQPRMSEYRGEHQSDWWGWRDFSSWATCGAVHFASASQPPQNLLARKGRGSGPEVVESSSQVRPPCDGECGLSLSNAAWLSWYLLMRKRNFRHREEGGWAPAPAASS